MNYGLYRKSSGGGATGVNVTLAGANSQFQETIDLAVTAPLQMVRENDLFTIQGEHVQVVKWAQNKYQVDGEVLTPYKNYSFIYYSTYDVSAASGIFVLNGQPVADYDANNLVKMDFAQLGDFQLSFSAGVVDTPTFILPAGKVAKMRAKGAFVTAIWVENNVILLTGDLENA